MASLVSNVCDVFPIDVEQNVTSEMGKRGKKTSLKLCQNKPTISAFNEQSLLKNFI